MPIKTRPVIKILQWKYCSVLRSWPFSERCAENYCSTTRYHLKSSTPCSREQQSYPGTTWTPIEDEHVKKTVPFYVSWGEKVFSQHPESERSWSCWSCELDAMSMSPRYTYVWLQPDIAGLTPDLRRHRCMLAHKHQNRNHQHLSHVLFADKSIVSLYNFNGHARIFRYWIVMSEWLNLTAFLRTADRGVIG